MKIQYIEKNFRDATLNLIESINEIIDEYARQGFNLTVRQVYYQLVSRDLIPNSERSYKKIVNTTGQARMAGLIPWTAIEDRTRHMRGNQHWENPQSIIQAAIQSYKINMWETQDVYPECWIEKDSLVDIISNACRRWDVPYFSCRGYASISSMWRAGHYRMKTALDLGKQPVIIHLGDHDPSGIDMTRDIFDRIAVFAGADVHVDRIALTMEQVDQFNPPPNPAKITDTRARDYIQVYGTSSWELDALDPTTLDTLIESTVGNLIDWEAWNESEEKLEQEVQWLKDTIGDST